MLLHLVKLTCKIGLGAPMSLDKVSCFTVINCNHKSARLLTPFLVTKQKQTNKQKSDRLRSHPKFHIWIKNIDIGPCSQIKSQAALNLTIKCLDSVNLKPFKTCVHIQFPYFTENRWVKVSILTGGAKQEVEKDIGWRRKARYSFHNPFRTKDCQENSPRRQGLKRELTGNFKRKYKRSYPNHRMEVKNVASHIRLFVLFCFCFVFCVFVCWFVWFLRQGFWVYLAFQELTL